VGSSYASFPRSGKDFAGSDLILPTARLPSIAKAERNGYCTMRTLLTRRWGSLTFRAADWIRQAKRDLQHARDDLQGGYLEWACFSAHQAGKKAVGALFQHLDGEARGHSITRLLKALAGTAGIPEDLQEPGLRPDRLYIPTRYANSFDSGAPADYSGEKDAWKAIGDGAAIVDFCEGRIPGPRQVGWKLRQAARQLR
jgi:HEPN domain-containing protein